jgi:hypothetical protein
VRAEAERHVDLRESTKPNRIFEAALQMAKEAGLVGRKRILDSTALYDAVATQDTVTMVRGAIRKLLQGVDDALGAQLRAGLKRDDGYASAGKPPCDWDDAAAREAPVMGQDLDKRDDGVFRIARRVVPARVISTVDPEARHGHKTASRGFDGYKGHIAIDPDSEIITATEVTAGNVGDAEPAEALLSDVLPSPVADDARPTAPGTPSELASAEPVEVYGDTSYGTADLVEKVEAAGVDANMRVQAPSPTTVSGSSNHERKRR